MAKTSEDAILAHSPSLAMGLLMSDNGSYTELNQQLQLSPLNRSLSQVVAPFIYSDESSPELENQYEQPIISLPTDYRHEKITDDDAFLKYQLEQELASIDALIDEY